MQQVQITMLFRTTIKQVNTQIQTDNRSNLWINIRGLYENMLEKVSRRKDFHMTNCCTDVIRCVV